MIKVKNFKTKIFCDGANFKDIQKYKNEKYIDGFTTNPTLMKDAGVKDYKKFCIKVLKEVKSKSVSFEIFF